MSGMVLAFAGVEAEKSGDVAESEWKEGVIDSYGWMGGLFLWGVLWKRMGLEISGMRRGRGR